MGDIVINEIHDVPIFHWRVFWVFLDQVVHQREELIPGEEV